MSTTPEYIAAFRERAERGRNEIEVAISDTVCDMVDDTVVPELMKYVGNSNFSGIVQLLLEEASKAITEGFSEISKWSANDRVFGRFQQHINGECADDEETKAVLRGLRIEKTYDRYIVVAA